MKKTYQQPRAEEVRFITDGSVANLIVGSTEGGDMLSGEKDFGSQGWNSDDWSTAPADDEE